MAIKQYHFAVFVEVNTETGQVGQIDYDPEAMVGGGGDNSVFNVSTGSWETPDWTTDSHAAHAETALNRLLDEHVPRREYKDEK